MPTQTKTNPIADSVEKVTERLTDLNEKAVSTGKRTSTVYLDSYEKTVTAIADSYEKALGATRIEWPGTVATAQADFTRELTKAYTSAARGLVV